MARGRTLIKEVSWFAECSCGWRTEAPNEPDVMTRKVQAHLMIFHRVDGADVALTSASLYREMGQLGRRHTPDARVALDAAKARMSLRARSDVTASLSDSDAIEHLA